MPLSLASRAASSNGPIWPVKDIVYVAIVGTVMLAALLEWILWLLAFLYCLAKVRPRSAKELMTMERC